MAIWTYGWCTVQCFLLFSKINFLIVQVAKQHGRVLTERLRVLAALSSSTRLDIFKSPDSMLLSKSLEGDFTGDMDLLMRSLIELSLDISDVLLLDFLLGGVAELSSLYELQKKLKKIVHKRWQVQKQPDSQVFRVGLLHLLRIFPPFHSCGWKPYFEGRKRVLTGAKR